MKFERKVNDVESVKKAVLMYKNTNKTSKEVAKECGVSERSIFYGIHKYDVKICETESIERNEESEKDLGLCHYYAYI